MKARAPAKVILSGEHAVVYGAPALALATALYTEACLETHDEGLLAIELPDLGLETEWTLERARAEVQASWQRHGRWLEGDGSAATLVDPLQLVAAALMAVDKAGSLIRRGVSVRVHSATPFGAGMGSSAAVIAAIQLAAARVTGSGSGLEERIALGTEVEALRHGRSSGLDVAVICRGGLVRFQQGMAEPRALRLPGHWSLVHTGAPESSTGEAVGQVRDRFGDSGPWADFAAVTNALEAALGCGDAGAVLELLRRNHRLLCRIGVVPGPVAEVIAALEQLGCAAKICGAGAVRGSAGGMLLVYHPDQIPPVLPLPGHYSILKLEPDHHGARV